MSKQYKIRWRESDVAELKTAVKDFNKKLRRLTKDNERLVFSLPEKASVRNLKNLINTRQDLRREINSLKRFLREGAEELVVIPTSESNVKITRWQRTEMNRRVAVINKRRKKRLEELSDLDLFSRGERLGYRLKDIGMGSVLENSLTPMKAFSPTIEHYNVRKKYATILRESQSDYFTKKDYRLRQNYIKALRQNYRANDIKEVIRTIKQMDIKEFLNKFMQEDDKMEWPYPPDEEQYQSYVSSLKAIWTPVS